MRLAILFVVCATAFGQEPARIATHGSVESKTGTPWQNARVTLISVMPNPRLGEPDVVEVVTSKRGRFAAMLRADRVYSAWAERGNGEDAKLTGLAREVAAGQVVHLVELDRQPTRPKVAVSGLDAWGRNVRISVRDRSGRRTPLALDSKLRAKLPVLPGDACAVEFSNPDGRRFFAYTVWLSEEARRRARGQRRALAGNKSDGTVERIQVPPPVALRIQVLARKTSQPVPSALVCCGIGSLLGPSLLTATTDGHGSAEMTVPSWLQPARSWEACVTTTASGFVFAEHYCAVPLIDARPPKLGSEPTPKDITFRLTKDYRCHGVVTNGAKPIAGVRLVYSLSVPHVVARQRVIETDSKGRWAIDGLGSNGWLELALVLPKSELPKASDVVPELRLSRLRVGAYQTHGRDIELPAIDLAKLRPLELRLRLPDGTPASHATVEELGPASPGSIPDKHEPKSILWDTIRSDKQGRARVYATQDKLWLAIQAREHYLHTEIDVTTAKNPLVLTLEPYAFVEGTVVSPKRSPLSGVSVHLARRRWTPSTVTDRRFVQFCELDRGKLLADTTDAKGRFRVHFIPTKGLTLGLVASKRVGGKNVLSDIQDFTGSASGVRFVLDVPDK